MYAQNNDKRRKTYFIKKQYIQHIRKKEEKFTNLQQQTQKKFYPTRTEVKKKMSNS